MPSACTFGRKKSQRTSFWFGVYLWKRLRYANRPSLIVTKDRDDSLFVCNFGAQFHLREKLVFLRIFLLFQGKRYIVDCFIAPVRCFAIRKAMESVHGRSVQMLWFFTYTHKRIVNKCVDPTAANSNKMLPASANLNFFEIFFTFLACWERKACVFLYTLVAGCLHLVLLYTCTLRERGRTTKWGMTLICRNFFKSIFAQRHMHFYELINNLMKIISWMINYRAADLLIIFLSNATVWVIGTTLGAVMTR